MKNLKMIFLFTAFLLPLSSVLAGNGALKEGIEALTTSAIQGPTVSCEEESFAFSPKYYEKGADCSKFIDSSGKLGVNGKTIVSHIKSLGPNSELSKKDHAGMQVACPNWPNLSDEQRAYYWVWVFGAIAWKESTCGAELVNPKATHGTAAGLLQLNKHARDRTWRGGSDYRSCKVPDVMGDEPNLKCGIEIMNEILKGKKGEYDGNGHLFGTKAHSYWKHLRFKNGGLIMRLIRDYPYCKK